MPQHPADGLDRHALLKRYQACKAMASDMIDDVSLDACQYTEAFHVGSQHTVVLFRQECFP